MKRTKQDTANRPVKPAKARTIGANQLTRVRGGSDLGIAVQVGQPITFDRQMQHNEALIRL
jgi:hypothetical protein